MNSKSADAPASSGLFSGIFAETLRGTFTTPGEQEFWSHFIPLRKLGKGSFGSVVAATRVADNVPVAIKTILRKRVRFVKVDDDVFYPKEFVTLIELSDVKGAIRILDCVETNDKLMIVLERPHNFIDLLTFLRKQRYLDENSAKKIILQLIFCINEFMEHNILHRDLKPANILVNEKTLEIKVIDFGLISDVECPEDTVYDRMGTQVYFPPESINEKRFFAGPGMVWVIGIITYEILTGSLPFHDEREIKTGPLRIPPRLSKACSSFIRSCLNRSVISRISLSSVANHPWLTSVTPVPSNLILVASAVVVKEESAESSEFSFCRLPEEDRFDEDNVSTETSLSIPISLEPEVNDDALENETMSSQSCEESDSPNCNSATEKNSNRTLSSDYEITQYKSADERMSFEEDALPDSETAEGDSEISSKTSLEVSSDCECLGNNKLSLQQARATDSVHQMCQFDSSMWEMIPVSIEDLQAAQTLCSMRLNI